MEARHESSDMERGETRPEWREDAHFEMCMGLKWGLDGDEVKFLRPGHNRLQVKYESRGLDGGEPGWSSGAVLVT